MPNIHINNKEYNHDIIKRLVNSIHAGSITTVLEKDSVLKICKKMKINYLALFYET